MRQRIMMTSDGLRRRRSRGQRLGHAGGASQSPGLSKPLPEGAELSLPSGLSLPAGRRWSQTPRSSSFLAGLSLPAALSLLRVLVSRPARSQSPDRLKFPASFSPPARGSQSRRPRQDLANPNPAVHVSAGRRQRIGSVRALASVQVRTRGREFNHARSNGTA